MADNPFNLSTQTGRHISVLSTDVEIQDGHFYKINDKVVDLAAGNTHTVHIKTASDYAYIQQVKGSFADGPVDIVIKEAPTISDGSSVPTFTNLNRNSTNTPNASVFDDSSGISGGTELETHFVPTGKDTAFVLDDQQRWVLKNNEDYIIQFVNNTGALLTFSYTIIYHEHNGA